MLTTILRVSLIRSCFTLHLPRAITNPLSLSSFPSSASSHLLFEDSPLHLIAPSLCREQGCTGVGPIELRDTTLHRTLLHYRARTVAIVHFHKTFCLKYHFSCFQFLRIAWILFVYLKYIVYLSSVYSTTIGSPQRINKSYKSLTITTKLKTMA